MKAKKTACKKGHVKKHGKCVRKKTKQKRHHKRHHHGRATMISAKTIAAALFASLALAARRSAGPALAEIQIDSFETTSTDTQAGGHPDLETNFTLAEAGVTQAAKNVIFNAPQGLFGNINAVTNCRRRNSPSTSARRTHRSG